MSAGLICDEVNCVDEGLVICLGRVAKGVNCSVKGCDKEASRSLSRDKVSGAGLKIGEGTRRSYLCRDHYKEYKKGSKKDKLLEQWRYKG